MTRIERPGSFLAFETMNVIPGLRHNVTTAIYFFVSP